MATTAMTRKTNHWLPLFNVFGVLLCTANFAGAALIPLELKVEYGSNAMGVDVPNPRLSWKAHSEQPAQRQTAYQVQVASSLAILKTAEPDLWDSGKIASSNTIHVPYSGKPLKSSQAAFWRVRIWDGSDVSSDWSPAAAWAMGLLAQEDWKGKWICAPASSEALLLRRDFVLKPGLVRAVAHVSGLGHYEMFLNGQRVGQDLFTPGWTDYDTIILYDTREVTSHLREGTNAIGLAVGNGMYNVVRRHRFAKFTGSHGPLRAILHLRLEYDDGSVEILGTDETWRVHPGPIVYNSIYGGEDYDARLAPRKWAEPGFDHAAWRNAVPVVRPSGQMRGFTGSVEPIRVIETRQPVAAKRLNDSATVYDFGQNASFMPQLKVTGPAGSGVTLVPAEVVHADGTIERSTMGSTNRGISWWQYTKATDAEESWFPQFYYVGCRYVEARCYPAETGGAVPVIQSLEGKIVHASAEPIGEFECSNPLVNRIRDLVRWAQRANMVSVLTDCPHREKLGWIEQYHLNGPAIRYEFDMARMFTKGMNDMAEAQLDNGMVPNIAPEFTEFKGAFRGAAEWGAAFILVPWQQYLFCGDVELLRRHYPAMKRYFAYLESKAADGILSEGLGDWFDLGPNKPGKAQLTQPEVTATAFYYLDAKTLADIAGLLRLPDEANEFRSKAEHISSRFNEKFYASERGLYATGSQCANALPLAMGIVEERHRAAVLSALVKDVESREYATSAGDVGFRYVLRALADNGRSDVVYRMITQDTRPGYAFMLKKGETSLTESWDANLTTSHNHFMLGQVTEWLYHDLAGIVPDATLPGFQRVIIKPQPVKALNWVKASYKSIRGMVRSEWRIDGSKFQLRVSIPANTTGLVWLPGKADAVHVESGQHTFEAAL